MRTKVYTDGACSGNPGPGGWAWVVPDGPYASGADAHTTNQRMELTAVLEAVGHLEGSVDIVSDSTYVVNCFRDGWWEGWLRRGWVNSQRKPVANRDLWEPLIDLVRSRDVTFTWVKGHAGDRWNDLADRLAVEAAASQTSRTGPSPPAESPAITLPDTASRPGRDIDGHVVVVGGLRPDRLGGYGDTTTAVAVRDRLIDILAAMRQIHPNLVVTTGMGLGAETFAAEAARAADVPYAAVLLHPDIDARWPPDARRHHRDLLDGAGRVVTLEKAAPSTPARYAAAIRRRDAWMRRNADEAVVVWDGEEPSVATLVRGLERDLGDENVWIVDPIEVTP